MTQQSVGGKKYFTLAALADADAHNENAFDALRFFAAFSVLFSHSYALYGLPEPRPIADYKLGSIAVFIFFAISGFLVTQSWVRDPAFQRFALRRSLRIFPGLFVVVVLSTFLLGPFVSSHNYLSYFSSVDTWKYFFSNIFAISGNVSLPGVFEENQYQNIVNDSLWTLRYEISMYLILAICGAFLPRERLPILCVSLAVAFGAIWALLTLKGIKHLTLPFPFVWRIGLSFDLVELSRLGSFFFIGACVFLFRNFLIVSPVLALILSVTVLFSANQLIGTFLLWLAVPYAVIVGAYRLPRFLCRLFSGNDISYGVYIYAFPVQQLISLLFFKSGISWFWAFSASAGLTIVLAFISWIYIERPALELKSMIVAKSRLKAC